MKLTPAQQAERIYVHWYGHLDDKQFHAQKVQEIEDWITSGDPATLMELIKEWGDYDRESINLNR